MLSISQDIASITPPTIPAPRREAMKARVMAAADAARTTGAAPGPRLIGRSVVRPVPWFMRPGAITAAAAAIILLFSWWATAHSLPDSPLYNIKLASERIMVNLTGGKANKAILNTDIANARLGDLRTMQQLDKLEQSQPALDNLASHVESAETILNELGSGDEHAHLAEALYNTVRAGQVILESMGADPAGLSATLQAKLEQVEDTIDSAAGSAEQALITEGINPATLQLYPYIVPFTTPLVPIPSSTSTSSVTPSASVTPSSTPEIVATATSFAVPTGAISLPETPTEEVDDGDPTASVPDPTFTPDLPNATATVVPTNTATISVQPTRTPTRQLTPTLTTTRTATVPPNATDTPEPNRATTTPVIEPSATASDPTVVPNPAASPTSAPVIPTTTTQVVLPTSTSEPTNTPTTPPAEPTLTPQPTDVPPEPTSTTPPPPPTDTPEPPPAPTEPPLVCNLMISMVSASCSSGGVVFSTRIENRSNYAVTVDWEAELQVRAGSGGFQGVQTRTGTVTLSVGESAEISGSFDYSFGVDDDQFRVNVSADTDLCAAAPKLSQARSACQLY